MPPPSPLNVSLCLAATLWGVAFFFLTFFGRSCNLLPFGTLSPFRQTTFWFVEKQKELKFAAASCTFPPLLSPRPLALEDGGAKKNDA